MRGQPVVVVRRILVLLIVEQFVNSEVLLGIALEHQQHAVHGQVGWGCADIEHGTSHRMGVSLECHDRAVVDWPRDEWFSYLLCVCVS